ncbi:putative hydrolase or acyltransferase of alpha/beta superfamily [Cylindrospermum stagnale PCC 7417]|uniref:Putative hydrolase or acyltransferase of alpha/beta superfamily n=1 Tax=Cylindrospermum stagnale PCC 7417 TaxID=56107 RepID=K9X0S4_9NOST|nr:alpha/beta hydrolase [Cylindrospermum stagnale]AFZ25636.1 putative hydrolase or acyltransferase of alpha/beta superfamily [Cylindrospermum stagnale PCC 7417]
MSVIETSWTHAYITTNGVKLHYVTQGEGPLMLMLHGFPEFWYSWRHQIPEFAKNFQVVALDLRGYNDSHKPKEQSAYVMAESIKDVQGIIQGLGYETCILVGHDWGGAIAWNFAYAHPDMVEKLIILNLPHPAKFAEGLRTPQQLLRSSYIFLFQLPLLPELLLQAADYAPIANAIQGTAVNKSAFTPADIDAYKDAAGKRGALTAMLNYYRNIFQSPTPKKTWSVLEVPTLLIWGEKDAALGKELTYGTAAYVRDFQIKYIANSGHWVQQEQPELVTQYMREFLSV